MVLVVLAVLAVSSFLLEASGQYCPCSSSDVLKTLRPSKPAENELRPSKPAEK